MNPFFPDRRIAMAVYATCLLFFAIFGVTEIRIRSRVDSPGHHGHDFGTYWTAGSAIYDGRDPYTITDYDVPPYIYPPFFAAIFLPFSKLPSEVAGMAWYALNVVLLALTHLELIRIINVNVGRALSPPGRPGEAALHPWITWPALIGLAPAAITTLQGGQVTIVLLFFLVLGFRLLGAVSDVFVFGLACVAAAIFSPVAWHHHFYLIAPALVFTRWKAAVVTAAAILVVHATIRYWILYTTLLGVGMAIWLLAVCAIATFYTAPRPSAAPIPAP